MESCKKMAVFAGCNYLGEERELRGCINDVTMMRDLVIERFGFEPENIEFMTDEPDSPFRPTGANIKAALNRMVERAEYGDILLFHFSGHGNQYPKEDGQEGLNEAIVPCDHNIILDDDFRALVNKLPEGATFTFLSDSCHSGGLIDKEKEQVGPHTTPTPIVDSDFQNSDTKARSYKSKHLPYDVLLQILQSKTNLESSDLGTLLDAYFGEDASAKFRRNSEVECEPYDPIHPDMGILLSGCQPEELSSDLPEDEYSEARGALSSAVRSVLLDHEGPISNRKLAMLVREKLKDDGVEQNPCLYCSDDNAIAPFLGQTA